jgi:phosphonate dehydrogenase
MGAVGQAIAKRLSGFEMALLYTDSVGLSEDREKMWGLSRLPLDDLLARSDYVLLSVPLTPDTFHLIDENGLSKMKPGSFLVNVCRGSVVNEESVAAAVASGHLAGYAADVFELEDRARRDRPSVISASLLRKTSATFLTPHLGSAVDYVRREISLEAARNILQAFQGLRPQGAINQLQVEV